MGVARADRLQARLDFRAILLLLLFGFLRNLLQVGFVPEVDLDLAFHGRALRHPALRDSLLETLHIPVVAGAPLVPRLGEFIPPLLAPADVLLQVLEIRLGAPRR